VVLAGVGVGEGVPLTVGSGLDAGDVAVIVGVGEADTVADGLPDEVAVGLALVDVDGLDEHALSSVAAQRPTPSHTSRRGRHSGLLRPAQPIAFLLWCVALPFESDAATPHRVPQIAELLFRRAGCGYDPVEEIALSPHASGA
jgi:hypothetical protein